MLCPYSIFQILYAGQALIAFWTQDFSLGFIGKNKHFLKQKEILVEEKAKGMRLFQAVP